MTWCSGSGSCLSKTLPPDWHLTSGISYLSYWFQVIYLSDPSLIVLVPSPTLSKRLLPVFAACWIPDLLSSYRVLSLWSVSFCLTTSFSPLLWSVTSYCGSTYYPSDQVSRSSDFKTLYLLFWKCSVLLLWSVTSTVLICLMYYLWPWRQVLTSCILHPVLAPSLASSGLLCVLVPGLDLSCSGSIPNFFQDTTLCSHKLLLICCYQVFFPLWSATSCHGTRVWTPDILPPFLPLGLTSLS